MLRKADSLKKTDKIIQDPVIEPFFIARSNSNGYTVYERILKGKVPYIRSVAYPSNFNHALKVIAREILDNSKTQEYNTIQEYIAEYKTIQEKLSVLTDF